MSREFYTFILPNGIRCIHKRVKSPVAHCALTINTGSRDEMPSEYGMAHLTEHSMFKGTTHRKAYHINCRLENLGGELNAFTTKEDTVIHATTLKSDFSKAAELIFDMVFNSTFPQKEVEKEKEIIIDEINSYKDSPADMLFDDFEDYLFAGSSLGHNILGSKPSVSKFTDGDIKQFVGRTYNTDQMVFSSIGNFSEKTFRTLMERYFGTATPSIRGFERKNMGEYKSFTKTVKRTTHQAHCIVGNRAPSIDDGGRIVLALLTNILGGPSANSLLNVSVREKHGLSYNIEAGYSPFTDTGIATIYFGTDKDKVDKCIELIDTTLNSVKNNVMSPRRISMAKKQFLGQLTVSMDNNESYMIGAAKSYLLYNDVDGLEAIHKKILSITDRQLMEMANVAFTDTSMLIYK